VAYFAIIKVPIKIVTTIITAIIPNAFFISGYLLFCRLVGCNVWALWVSGGATVFQPLTIVKLHILQISSISSEWRRKCDSDNFMADIFSRSQPAII
jgi:hypothetical protein